MVKKTKTKTTHRHNFKKNTEIIKILFKVNGVIYGDNTSPFSEYFNPSVKPAKMGEATCTSYFRIITLGACGINDAMENGKITRVNSIDKHSKNILLFHKATLRVYGE